MPEKIASQIKQVLKENKELRKKLKRKEEQIARHQQCKSANIQQLEFIEQKSKDGALEEDLEKQRDACRQQLKVCKEIMERQSKELEELLKKDDHQLKQLELLWKRQTELTNND